MHTEASGALERASVMLANVPDASELLRLSRLIEEHGYQRVWFAENNGLEAASAAGAIAATTGLEVGTAVVPVFNRSPALLAMMAMTWSSLSNRPVHLGIGAGGQVLVEDWHGRDFTRPRAAVEETLDVLSQAFSGERTSVRGSVQRSEGFRPMLQPAATIHIYIGGMGPQMTRLAGRRAAGLILTWIPADEIGTYRSALDESAHERTLEERARLLARVYVGVVEDVATMREQVRQEMVEYVLSPPYAKYFSSIGHAPEVERVRSAFDKRDRTAAVAGVSDDLLDRILIAGQNPHDISAKLDAYFRAGADEIIVQTVPAARGGDPGRTLAAVADALRTFSGGEF